MHCTDYSLNVNIMQHIVISSAVEQVTLSGFSPLWSRSEVCALPFASYLL